MHVSGLGDRGLESRAFKYPNVEDYLDLQRVSAA